MTVGGLNKRIKGINFFVLRGLYVNLNGVEDSQKDPKKQFSKTALASLGLELGFIIALPVVAFGLLGRWLDARLETEPLLTLIGILTAIIFTTIWIYRKFRNYFDNQKKQ